MKSVRVIPVSAVLSRVPYEWLYLQKWVTPPLSGAAPHTVYRILCTSGTRDGSIRHRESESVGVKGAHSIRMTRMTQARSDAVARGAGGARARPAAGHGGTQLRGGTSDNTTSA